MVGVVPHDSWGPIRIALVDALDALAVGGDLRPIGEYDDRVDFRNLVVDYRDRVCRFDPIVTP